MTNELDKEPTMEMESGCSTDSSTLNTSALSATILKFDKIARELAQVRREKTKSIVKYQGLIHDHQLSALVKKIELQKDDSDLSVPDVKIDNLLQRIEQYGKSENSIEAEKLMENFKVKNKNLMNEHYLINEVMNRLMKERKRE